ncbi:hypothetical protein SAZ11_60535 [Streptomyces sp. FXJ1.4098]|nr:hypothetical protein [Streptomyces sp. FXJ1.4098]
MRSTQSFAGGSRAGVGAALGRLERLSGNFHYMQVECALILTALNGLAAELRAAKKKLDNAVQDAQDAGMTVKEDGSVEYKPPLVLLPGQEYEPPGNGRTPYVTTTPKQRAQGFADRIGDALKDATEADGKYAKALGKLITTADLSVTKDDWIDADNDRGRLRRRSGTICATFPRTSRPRTTRPGGSA